MSYATGSSYDYCALYTRAPRRRTASPFLQCACVTVGFGLVAAAMVLLRPQASAPELPGPPQRVAVAKPAVAAAVYSPLIDAAYSFGPEPLTLAQSAPLASDFAPAAPPAPVASAPAASPAPVASAGPAAPEEAAAPAAPAPDQVAETPEVPVPAPSPSFDEVPLPAPRPPDLRFAQPQTPVRGLGRQIAGAGPGAPPPTAPADTRNFIEKLFGMPQQPTGPMLAYAGPEDGSLGGARNPLYSPAPGYDRQTAVYNIATHTVYMPDGSRLEAHSGLGDRLDDPRHVSERMRGATPPHLYDLQLREQLFHGVQALRLNPVGGSGVFGRTGLLAHTYMLGPTGASNGCVSFRNYQAFLQAYLRGDVRRLVVVAGI